MSLIMLGMERIGCNMILNMCWNCWGSSLEDMEARPYGCNSASGQNGTAPAAMGEARGRAQEALHHAQEALQREIDAQTSSSSALAPMQQASTTGALHQACSEALQEASSEGSELLQLATKQCALNQQRAVVAIPVPHIDEIQQDRQ